MAASLPVLLNTARRNVRVLTPYKLYNAARVASSFYLSRRLKKVRRWGEPCILMVEPTNFCNLECPLCPSGNGSMTRKRGNMELDLYVKLIDDMKSSLFLVMFWNQGEPFINKALLDMIRYAQKNRVASVVSTNGHFTRSDEDANAIIESGLNEIIISLDGASPESYTKYRVGGDYNQVIDGIRRLVRAKAESGTLHPIIHLQFLLFRHNRHEIKKVMELAEELGADKISYKTAQVYTDAEAERFLPDDKEMNRYEERNGSRMLKVDWTGGCKRIWFTAMVNWNGDVAPCCYDKDVEFKMGDAAREDIHDIWNGKQFSSFRKRVLRLRPSIEMCRNCAEGLKIKQFRKVRWVKRNRQIRVENLEPVKPYA